MNLENIRVTRAGPDHAEELADLSRRCFYDTYNEYNTAENMDLFLSGPLNREKLIREVQQGKEGYLLIVLDAKIVAYALMREGENHASFEGLPAMEIARFYADTSVIGKGFGRLLMEYCIRTAREQGVAIIWLGVWEQNQRAVQFYRKMGFERWSEQVFMLGNDPQTDWLLKLDIR